MVDSIQAAKFLTTKKSNELIKKIEGWEEPEIEERLECVERTIVTLSFRQRVPKKSAEKKVPEKTRVQYEMILSAMESGRWYQAKDFLEVVGVKERRMRILLGELTAAHLLEDNGSTKGKKYRKL